MIKRVLPVLFAILLFSASTTTWSAVENLCEEMLLTPYGDLTKGISLRGFLGNEPPVNSTTELAALDYMVWPWGLRIYAVKSVEEAFKLNDDAIYSGVPAANRGQNPFVSPSMGHLFVLTAENPADYIAFKGQDDQAQAKFNQLASESDVFFFDLKGNKILLTKDEVARLNSLMYMPQSQTDHFFYQRGWVSPEYRGIESVQRFLMSSADPTRLSSQTKEARKKLRSLMRDGAHITFNRNLDAVMKLASGQARVSDLNKVEAKDPEEGSYPERVRKRYLDLQSNGNAYSVEVWDRDPNDPSAVLMGGVFGKMKGGYVSVDSMAYNGQKKVRAYVNGEPGYLVKSINDSGNEQTKVMSESQLASIDKSNVQITPQYIWYNPFKDQKSPEGGLEFLLEDGTDRPLEVPNIEWAKYANIALYEYFSRIGIDTVDVQMVTKVSKDSFGARYESRLDALKMMRQQIESFGDRGIELPAEFVPEGMTEKELKVVRDNQIQPLNPR